ncbi:hypothetical protein [Serratia proteamaculans]|uniref:Bacteriocin n=1 Tax=Serratia proteamaculans TaxID=28151 RepID=A0ABS0TUC4_SERPR|nr:hypothetical protein [Serratia proteamaculans]MBI6181960.1 hypothetical protein [Serratia proteamaculans]RYM50224.1 hypothetical protein BSQ97_16795 [Serratia proteamaculans]
MRELTTKEILTISGGNADSGYEGRGCASQVTSDAKRGALAGGYAGAIVGGLRGLPDGPTGIAAGAISGFAYGSIRGAAIEGIRSYSRNCGDNNNRNDPLGGNSSRNSVNGQCRW